MGAFGTMLKDKGHKEVIAKVNARFLRAAFMRFRD